MELFVINRYTGDDSLQEKKPNEEILRKKLQKKINKRKKINEFNTNKQSDSKFEKYESINSEGDNYIETEIAEPERKKIKCQEINNASDIKSVVPSSEVNDTEFDKINKKKRKLKKHEYESSVPEDEVVEEALSKNREDKNKIGFTILGDTYMCKKEKVKRKLPNWLANPSVVSVDLKHLTYLVDSVPELDKVFVDKLRENKITHFFPVQSQIIPWLLKNAEKPRIHWASDICVSAPTGSGKTLAFVLPILQILSKRIVPKIRALVVLPVQDLANQVFHVFQTYSAPTNLNILLLSKIRPFKEEQSLICRSDGMGNYRTMVDIIVTTPGRLVDHLTSTKGLCFDELKYLIIDEADRVMENVQNDWLYHLNKCISSECIRSYQVPVVSYQNLFVKRRPPNKLLFSATLSQDPEKLQQLGLFQPKLFTSVVKSETSKENGLKDKSKFVGKYTTPAELTEYYINCSKANKPLILHHLIKTNSWRNVLCFVNSAEATSRLAFVLKALSEKDSRICKLSANLTIKRRNLILKKFSSGDINILVCSDSLARGIDIPNVEYVISYGAPKFIKTYIHRIGRTGRAGKQGTSVTLLTSKEKNRFQKMIETAGKAAVEELDINEEDLKQYHTSYEKALSSLGALLEKKKQRSIKKLKTRKKLQLQAAKGEFSENIKKHSFKKNRTKSSK